jgi:hypothetical protein
MQQPKGKVFVLGGLVIALIAMSGRTLYESLKPVYPKPVPVHDPPRPGVSVQEAREKLRNLGKYLAIYRRARTVLPPKDRRNYKDAGLPESLDQLVGGGKPWSLPHGTDDLRLLAMPYKPHGLPSVREYISIEDVCHIGRLGGDAASWSARGEDRPIFMIQRIVDDEVYRKGKYPVVILRLNGKVDIVPYDSRRMLDLLSE